ncbi:hypothetical protein N9566_00250 [bacterium]|nr:hypothetical protein [bacterium]
MSDNEKMDVNGWTPELLKQRRRRAAIMGIALALMVSMFFLVTVVRLGENIAGG